MTYALIWLSGFSACAALEMFMRGDPWAWFLVFACLASANLARIAQTQSPSTPDNKERENG